jgi:hypothetical protein
MLDLRRKQKIEPAACAQHSFDPVDGRCIHCNLHYFHLPALQSHAMFDADAGRVSRPGSAA